MTLSKYVKIIMNSQFPATTFMGPAKFIEYLKERGLVLSIGNLEYYDKLELLRPILRLRVSKTSSTDTYSYSNSDIFDLKHYYSMGLVQPVLDGDFKPWSGNDSEDDSTFLFYHLPPPGTPS